MMKSAKIFLAAATISVIVAVATAQEASEGDSLVHLHVREHFSNIDKPKEEDVPEFAGASWRSFLELTALCFAMLLGAFGAGIAPLHVSLNQKQLRSVNALGAGLFIGTALAVIIPEGIHSLYNGEFQVATDASGASILVSDSYLSNETTIGFALVSGFLLMLCVDHLLGQSHPPSHGNDDSLPALDSNDAYDEKDQSGEADDAEKTLMADEEGPGLFRRSGSVGEEIPSQLHKSKSAVKRRATVTLGLLVHAAADGIALGATKASSADGSLRHVELMVFFAIMMHKVPAAFGLSVYLRGTGLDTEAVRRNIAYFALAAPVAALGVFLLMDYSFMGLGELSPSLIGFVILFSAGTFLYVSLVHALSELPRNESGTFDRQQLGIVIVGSILPLLISVMHDH